MMDEHFVKMVKDGVQLLVHPSTVKSHQRAGWTIVKEAVPIVTDIPVVPVVDEKPADESVKPIRPPARPKK